MVAVKPFLPDIIQGVVSRVDATFSSRSVDPFNVFFDKGIIQQVRRSVYQAPLNFPLVWMVYKFSENYGGSIGGRVVNLQLILAVPTDPNYTQQQRDDISYKPRLLPIYEQLMMEMKREKWLSVVGVNGIKHTCEMWPYWGMGDVETPTAVDTLFKNRYIDAISIPITGLVVRREQCGNYNNYPILPGEGYPITQQMLTFFDDIELIVDGDNEFDPVDGASSVIIPDLLGKDFEIEKRTYGQLRRIRNAEVVPDTDLGGFALVNQVFSHNDTYIVRIRPMYVPAT